jgi:hypothetical protein
MDKMLPDLQASFACEDVRVEAGGAHTIVGIMNFVGAPQFPVRLLKFCIWTRWCSGQGTYTQTTRLVRPDQITIMNQAVTPFKLEHEESHATNVNFFAGLEFPEPGVYEIEILLDNVMRLRYPLPFGLVKPPNA